MFRESPACLVLARDANLFSNRFVWWLETARIIYLRREFSCFADETVCGELDVMDTCFHDRSECNLSWFRELSHIEILRLLGQSPCLLSVCLSFQ